MMDLSKFAFKKKKISSVILLKVIGVTWPSLSLSLSMCVCIYNCVCVRARAGMHKLKMETTLVYREEFTKETYLMHKTSTFC